MAVKRKDFQKTSAYIHQFLLKLDFTPECAEVRDALNLALLHMQKYYRHLRRRLESRDRDNASLSNSSLRGLSPMTPPVERPERFDWRWQDLEGRRMSLLRSQEPGLPLGMSLALSASKTGDLETLRALFSNNPACLDECDGLGRSLLMYAVQFEQYDTAQWLLNSGANVNATAHDQSTALHLAAHRGLWNFTELLIGHRASVDCQDSMGRAPMHWAVTTSTTECLKILIKGRANPSIRDSDLATPSMWACRLDNIDHFAILSRLVRVDEFADGMERDASGWTFLHWAVRRQEPLECLRTLITEENAVVTDMSGRNVLMVAAEQGSLPACKIIMEVCGKSIIDYRDQDSRSAVHLATIGGHGEVLNFLLDQGADMELRDRDHATPWDYAKQRQLNYCKLILASHYRQRSKDLELASQNSLQDQMRASVNMDMQPRPPATPPSGRSKSPSSSTRRRLRGVVAPMPQQQQEQQQQKQPHPEQVDDQQNPAFNDTADSTAEGAFERRAVPSPSGRPSPDRQQQQLQLLESYRTMDSEDFQAAAAAATFQAAEPRRPSAARGGPRPTPSPRSQQQSPQQPTPPPVDRRLMMRSQPPYKLQRQMAENNGSVDSAAAALDASQAMQPHPPPPPQFGGDVGSTVAGGHPPRTPPDKQRLIGPPPQLMPLNYANAGRQPPIAESLPPPSMLPPPTAPQQQHQQPSNRKKKKTKGKRLGSGGSSGSGSATIQQLSPPMTAASSNSSGQNGFASPTAPLQPLHQPSQHLSPGLAGGWQGYQRPVDLPPPVTPRSAVSGRISATDAAAAGGFIPPPVGFGNASAENSPRTASPQPLSGGGSGVGAVSQGQAIGKSTVYFPNAGRPRPPRGFGLQQQQ